jgi:acetylornithine/succinyldiaminopimelate/putrescine aminotransferase
MQSFTNNPVLGHITTFGGHPVCCAAGMAAFNVLQQEKLIEGVTEKEKLFRQYLSHPEILAINSKGLLIAVKLSSPEKVMSVLQKCLQAGLFSDWFLFAADCIRIAPPLTIAHEEIKWACDTIISCL